MKKIMLLFFIFMAGCSSFPNLPNEVDFYGYNVSYVIEYFGKKGVKCDVSIQKNIDFPSHVDLSCVYQEKAFFCPERYKAIMVFDEKSGKILGPALVDRRSMCF